MNGAESSHDGNQAHAPRSGNPNAVARKRDHGAALPVPSNIIALGDAKRAGAGPGKPEARRASERVIDAFERAGANFWQDADGEAFVSIPRGGWIERHGVKSAPLRMLARLIFGDANETKGPNGMRPGGLSDRALSEALDTMAAFALRGERREAAHRSIAADGGVWIDLGDDCWGLIRVEPSGWRIVASADVPLIRSPGMRELPRPESTNRLDAMAALRRLLNTGSEADLMLIVAWMIAALWPSGPYPVLAIDGEQGSGKSVAARIIRELVDPNKAAHRAAPRDEHGLIYQAVHARVLSIDNASFINAETGDTLCRVSTGAGFGTRKLYSDTDEIIIQVCRPVLINGIPNLLSRADLADRSLTVTLPTIADEDRRDEVAIFADLKASGPSIMALLLDGIVTAQGRLPTLALSRTTRMADFCRLACAAAPAFGWSEDDMLGVIEGNRRSVTADVIAADAFAEAVAQLARTSLDWTGTASDLLRDVNASAHPDATRDKSWPKNSSHASSHLKRAMPALRQAGVIVSGYRESGGRRMIHLAIEPGAPS